MTQDEVFAQRLAKKERQVLYEIDAAYSDHLRDLLRRYHGPGLNDTDINGIVEEALLQTWRSYNPEKKVPVRVFYFNVAKRRLQDHLRKAYRSQLREQRRADQAPTRLSDARAAAEELIHRETNEIYGRIEILISQAVGTLTPRQRKAYEARFLPGGTRWAKELEKQTGVPARQWRKASDEAVGHVRAYLTNHGVHYSREEGRYEVA